LRSKKLSWYSIIATFFFAVGLKHIKKSQLFKTTNATKHMSMQQIAARRSKSLNVVANPRKKLALVCNKGG
jgi:hypothetical protein